MYNNCNKDIPPQKNVMDFLSQKCITWPVTSNKMAEIGRNQIAKVHVLAVTVIRKCKKTQCRLGSIFMAIMVLSWFQLNGKFDRLFSTQVPCNARPKIPNFDSSKKGSVIAINYVTQPIFQHLHWYVII